MEDLGLLEADSRYPRPIFSTYQQETFGGFEGTPISSNNSSGILQRTIWNNAMELTHMRHIFFYAYGIVGPMIITIGLIGNSLTLITFLGRTPIWSNGTTYTYLKWLAITDTGALIMAIPMEVRLSMPWRHLQYWEAFYQAHLELPVLNSFMGSSIFIVVCLTGTRFLAVFHPSRYRGITHKSARAGIAVFLAMALAVSLSAPLVMLKEVTCGKFSHLPAVAASKAAETDHLSSSDYDYCIAKENIAITHRGAWQAFIVLSEGIVRVVPVISLTILNLAMICKFRSVAKRRRAIVIARSSNTRAEAARVKERHKLILLSTIIVLFVCFNSPSAVLSMIYKESLEKGHSFQVFRAVSNDCELANFAVNFYAYFLCSKDFRTAFFSTCSKLFPCFMKRRAGSSDSLESSPSNQERPAALSCCAACLMYFKRTTYSNEPKTRNLEVIKKEADHSVCMEMVSKMGSSRYELSNSLRPPSRPVSPGKMWSNSPRELLGNREDPLPANQTAV